ncbi:MAG: hypothetical protein V3R94_13045 [Acidobacteriota bacterium]
MSQLKFTRRMILISAALTLAVTLVPGQRRPSETVTVYESPT